jgi:hypothetical protein
VTVPGDVNTMKQVYLQVGRKIRSVGFSVNEEKQAKCMIVSPIPVAARSTAWFCCRTLAGIVGSSPTEGMDVCLL